MRTIRLYSLFFVATLLLACKNETKDTSQDLHEEVAKTQLNTNENWDILFDGTNFEHWRGYNMENMPTEWTIEEGAMAFTPGKDGSKNLVTKEKYTNFVLSLEWKISKKGNSGVFYGVYEDPDLGEPYLTGPEIQVIDNERHPDAKLGDGTHSAGSLYDMIAPSQLAVNPAGEWNVCEISINHKTNEGSVTLNGVNIVNFPVEGDGWDALVANSKFKDWEGFGDYTTGHIALQDHGDKVWYRNIKIKNLD